MNLITNPPSNCVQRNICSVCGGEVSRLLFNMNGFDIVQCKNCKHKYIKNPGIDTSLDKTLVFNSGLDINKKPHFRHMQIINLIKRHFKNVNALNIADIGSGFGYLGKIINNELPSCNYTGFELDRQRVEFCLSNGVNAVQSEFVEKEGYYNIIIIDNVIEHVLSPTELLRSISFSLKQDGMAIIIVPNRYDIRRFLPKYWGNHDFLYIPAHINFFSFRDILKLAFSSGLKLTSFNYYTLAKDANIFLRIKTVLDLIGLHIGGLYLYAIKK